MNPRIITQPIVHHPPHQLLILLAHVHVPPPVRHPGHVLALALERRVARTLRALPQVVEAVRHMPLLVFRFGAVHGVCRSLQPRVAHVAHDHVQAVELVQRRDAVPVALRVRAQVVGTRQLARVGVGDGHEAAADCGGGKTWLVVDGREKGEGRNGSYEACRTPISGGWSRRRRRR